MFGVKQRTGGYNPKVAAQLSKLGVHTDRDKLERRERGLIAPKVAGILEGLGVHVPVESRAPDRENDDVVNEEQLSSGPNPLDQPGQQPAVDPNAPPSGPTDQQQQRKPTEKPSIKLNQPARSMRTLQDVSDQMTAVTKKISVLDKLIQALSEDESSDKSIAAHKETLRGPIREVLRSVANLQKMVE